jgi:hypothetical protein
LIQGEDQIAPLTLHPGRDAADAQFRSLSDGFLTDEVKVSLQPFIVEVANLSDLQVDLDDLGSLMAVGILKGDVQNALSH